MKAEPILQELEAVKERLGAEAHDDLRLFLDQMDAWLVAHPHAGPVVKSSEELAARLRSREAAELPPPAGKPYKVYDPIIAEVRRNREARYQERPIETLALKDEPPRKKR